MISVDTELLESFPDYSSYGNSSVDRVRFVLMKLDSDRRAGTDYFSSKFTGKMKLIDKVKAIFNGLPKPKELITFTINDLPLLTTIDPKLAVHRSNNQNRDATPGQKAMATAMAFPDPAKLKRKAMFPEETSDAGFNKATLSKARYVLRNSPMVEGERYPRRCLSANVNRRHNRRAPGGSARNQTAFRLRRAGGLQFIHQCGAIDSETE